MTTEAVFELFCDVDLRQHIIDEAKRLTGNRKWQKDLVGHAWFVLGEAKEQRTAAYYRELVDLVMARRVLLLIYGEAVIT